MTKRFITYDIQVFDEIGPAVFDLGETAGFNGPIYPLSKFNQFALTEEDIIGQLKGSCSVVGIDNDHYCTYEILLSEENGNTFGSIILAGAVEFRQEEGGFLLVEATGDAYSIFDGGWLAVTYQSIGFATVITADLVLE